MQPIAADLRSLIKLKEGFAKAATTGADRRAVSAALRKALQPMLDAVRRKTPYGKTGKTAKLIRPRLIDSLRIKLVEGEGDEVVRGLVGGSRAKGKAGYKMPFITRGVKNAGRGRNINLPARPILERAERETIDEVIKRFGDLIEPELLKQLKNL